MEVIRIALFLFWMWMPRPGTGQLNFRTKDLKVEKSAACPNSESNAIQMENYSNYHLSRTLIVMNSDIHVLRNITGALMFQMRVNRCNLDLTKCDPYEHFKVRDFCEKLAQTDAMWSKYSNNIRPRMRCPIKQGTYKLINGTFDFTLASRMPIDGNRWVTYMKLFEDYADESAPKITKQRQVWCLDSDVRITLSKSTKPTRGGRKHPPRPTNAFI